MAFDTQVLVVGAGPVGVFMAAELCRHGVACRIVDDDTGPRDNARATTIQSRTLEVLESVGIVDHFIEAGVVCPVVAIYGQDMKPLTHISFSELDSPFPFALSLEQSRTERLLGQQLGSFGKEVEWNVSLREFTQDTDGVTAVLDRPGGKEESVRTSYLVGCDGAHSTVRHHLGVAFEGEDYPRDFMVAEMRIDWRVAMPPNQLGFFVSDAGTMFYTPFAGGRWLISADLGLGHGDQPPPDGPPLETIQSVVNTHTPGAVLTDLNWSAYYRAHLRQADRYHAGRVFLAGDAAHVQSPAGGQGMNTGLQDAHNLAWKLGLVSNGLAPAAILDSYHPERHRAGKDMLILNEYLYHTEMEGHRDMPIPEALRRRLAGILAGQEVIHQRMKRAIAELNINYRHSPIVARHRLLPSHGGGHDNVEGYHDFGAAPHAGDRSWDGRLVHHPSGVPVRFDQVRQGIKHHLFILTGLRAGEETYGRLRSVADTTAREYGRTVDIHFVVPHEVPPEMREEKALLVDPRGDLHHRYGAVIESLYLIRPDGYVGFRSQPVDAKALSAYLAKIFL